MTDPTKLRAVTPPTGALWLLLLLLTSGCLDQFGPDVRELTGVRRVDSTTKPTDRQFREVPATELPDVWSNATRQDSQSGWYRTRLELDGAPSVPWAVYLPRFAQSAEVFVNGHWIGSSGRVVPPLSRNWNRPLFLSVPDDALHAGRNRVDVHLAVEKTAPGFLRTIFIGPATELWSAYRIRNFLQIVCAQYGAVLMTAMALILGFIALQREDFRPFRFFAAACVFWALASAELFIQETPVPGRSWQVIAMSFAALSIILFAQTTHRSFGRPRRRIEVRMFAGLAAVVGLLLIVPDRYFELASLVLWLFCILVGTYLGILFVFGDRPPVARGRALMVLGVVGLLIGTHDVLLGLWVPVQPSVFLAPLLSLIAAFWGAWIVIDHFLSALRESETLNLELEQRVATKHAELEANYQRLRELEQQRVVSTERERLMREMHDGMGGQLVSALAMAEDGETSPPQIAEVIRGALDDMRLVIDSLDPVIDDVPTLLGMIRGRIEPRLRVHGLRFDWRVTDLPPTPHFGPGEFLNILRIAQEAITNIVKHADANVIRVETEEIAGDDGRAGIRVSIGDDGKGLGSAASNGGRGLSNMRVRAQRLHGDLDVQGDPGNGTTVRLWMPMDPPSAEE